MAIQLTEVDIIKVAKLSSWVPKVSPVIFSSLFTQRSYRKSIAAVLKAVDAGFCSHGDVIKVLRDLTTIIDGEFQGFFHVKFA